MKIISYILGIILIFLGFAYFLLFTQSGNDIIKPYISSIISKKSGQKIEIKTLHLKPNHITTTLNINDMIDLDIDGDISLLSQKLNLTYQITGKEIKTAQKSVRADINIVGKVEGELKNLKIYGKGEAFSSPVKYFLKIVNNIPQDIRANITQGKIEELLKIAGVKPYLKGIFDLKVDIPKFDPNDLKGMAKAKIYKSIFNAKEIYNDYKIKIPSNSFIEGEILSNLHQKAINSSADIKSTFANLLIKKAIINLSNNFDNFNLKSDYEIFSNLKNLSSVANLPLRGDIKINGEIEAKGKEFEIKGESKSLGGTTSFKTDGKKLLLAINEGKIEKLLYILGKNELSKGNLNIDAKIENLQKTPKIWATLQTTKAILNKNEIKKEFKIDIGENLPYTLTSKINSIKDNMEISTNFNSPILKFEIPKGIYNPKKSNFHAAYKAYLKDLAKLKPIISKKLKGDMKITGEIKKENQDLIITGKSEKFGGELDFVIKNGVITFKGNKIRVSKILQTALYPVIADGEANIEAWFNLLNKKGEIKAKIDKARILRSSFTDMIVAFTKYDFTKEKFNETTFESKIDQDIVIFNFLARSEHSYISFKNGKINIKDNTIEAPFDILIKKKDFKGIIKGNINKPKVKLNASKYLKEKAVHTIEKLIEKKLGKDGEKSDKIEKIKGFLDLFKK